MKNSATNRHNVVIAPPTPKVIGIVGGRGAMGRLLTREFEASGYKVITTGRADGVSDRVMRTLNFKLLRQADVVVIATPIAEVNKGMKHIFGPRALRGLRGKFLFDICSTKTEPMHRMAAAAGGLIAGCHPMFGPAVQEIRGKNVVLVPLLRGCRVRDTNTLTWTEWLSNWWQARGACVHFMGADEHDLKTAINQVAVVGIVAFFARVAERLGIAHTSLAEISTPNSSAIQMLAGKMLQPTMVPIYAALTADNKYAPIVAEILRDAAEEFYRQATAKDSASLERLWTELAVGIGPEFRAKAVALSKKFETAAAA